jgi:hypothetical protein
MKKLSNGRKLFLISLEILVSVIFFLFIFAGLTYEARPFLLAAIFFIFLIVMRTIVIIDKLKKDKGAGKCAFLSEVWWFYVLIIWFLNEIISLAGNKIVMIFSCLILAVISVLRIYYFRHNKHA